MLRDVPSLAPTTSLVIHFEDLPSPATPIAGGKGACLSRMIRAGLRVPSGFVVTADAFQQFLGNTGGDPVFQSIARLDVSDDAALENASERIRKFILDQPFPPELRDAISTACQRWNSAPLLAVRSSAVSEDGESASFAGQQETFLNVRGTAAVIERVKDCWASFFTPRALFYRAQKGTLEDKRMAVVIQEMAIPDKSGVLFTVDPVQKNRDHMVIEAVFGLGEAIVSGALTPDHYVIDRTTGAIVRDFIAVQPMALVYDPASGQTVERELPESVGASRALGSAELNALRDAGLRLESLFGSPQDVEWCFQGSDLILLQSRPITTL